MTSDPAAIHQTVLLREVVEWLRPHAGGRYLDGTLGMGGHTLGLLTEAPDAHVLCLDRDTDALTLAERRLAAHAAHVRLAHSAFSRFDEVLTDCGWDALDGVVLDLGVSSLHLDTAERGFSFLADGPLDMRMDPSGDQPSARDLVNRLSHGELARIIREYGDDPMAGRIASFILKAREEAEIETTARLAAVVEASYPAKMRRQARNHPATRTFQALRIAVNQELDEIQSFLEKISRFVKPGGRVAVISFHSLEDRAVKRAFKRGATGCTCPLEQMHCTCGGVPLLRVLTKKPQLPTDEEIANNPRSRSAKLRVAERLDEQGHTA